MFFVKIAKYFGILLLMCLIIFWWFVLPNLSKKDNLYLAIKSNDGELVKEILQMDPYRVHIPFFGEGAAPIIIAAGFGNINILEILVDAGADIEEKGLQNLCTPLHYAAHQGNKEAVRYLIQKGAKVNSKDRNLETPLHYAAYYGDIEIIKLLLENGAKVNSKTLHFQETPLEIAIKYNKVEAVRFLIEYGTIIEFDTIIKKIESELDSILFMKKKVRKEKLEIIELMRGRTKATNCN